MQLIPIENVNAIELFKSEKTLTALLDEIKKTATDFIADTSTEKGRKEIASQAYKVSQSKTVIDSAGKDLTADWLRKKKEVDSGRKTARDFCDNLRDEIRQPLTEWEEEEKKLAVIAAQKAEMDAAELEAYAEDSIFEREREIARKEAEIATKEEAARIEREQQEAEDRRIATEKRLKAEAEEQARLNAQAKIDDAQEEVAREKREREEEKERARLAEIEAAKQSERDRLQAIKDTEDRLERESIERDRLLKIAREKEERKANQKRHVSKINKSVVASFVGNGMDEGTAGRIVDMIACESISHLRIDYMAARKAA